MMVLALAALLAAGPQPQEKTEITSLLGKPLAAKTDDTGAIAKADAALAADPKNLDLLLAAARARDSVLRFNDAIRLYSQGIKGAPDDVRFYRFRGHRYISTRRFKPAIADLEKARKLAPSSFDVAYHLGLAYYLSGEYAKAAEEYGRCLNMKESSGRLPAGWRDCSSVASNDDARVAISDWLYKALRRAGRHREARSLLDVAIHDRMVINENHFYVRTLRFYKGLLPEFFILDPSAMIGPATPTIMYGIANFYLLEGKTERACELFRRAIENENWSAFGYIAAEMELARASRQACGGG